MKQRLHLIRKKAAKNLFVVFLLAFLVAGAVVPLSAVASATPPAGETINQMESEVRLHFYREADYEGSAEPDKNPGSKEAELEKKISELHGKKAGGTDSEFATLPDLDKQTLALLSGPTTDLGPLPTTGSNYGVGVTLLGAGMIILIATGIWYYKENKENALVAEQ